MWSITDSEDGFVAEELGPSRMRRAIRLASLAALFAFIAALVVTAADVLRDLQSGRGIAVRVLVYAALAFSVGVGAAAMIISGRRRIELNSRGLILQGFGKRDGFYPQREVARAAVITEKGRPAVKLLLRDEEVQLLDARDMDLAAMQSLEQRARRLWGRHG